MGKIQEYTQIDSTHMHYRQTAFTVSTQKLSFLLKLTHHGLTIHVRAGVHNGSDSTDMEISIKRSVHNYIHRNNTHLKLKRDFGILKK